MNQGHVYFIRPVGMVGPIKIGTTLIPMKRLKELTHWSPFPLEIIGAVVGGHFHETFLHNRFANQHSHSEWFHSSPLLLQTIDRLLAGETFESACADIPVVGKIRSLKVYKIRPKYRQRQKRQKQFIGLPRSAEESAA